VELLGDKDICRSHFVIRYDADSQNFMLKDRGVGQNNPAGTFVKITKKHLIRQGMLFIIGSQYFVVGYLLE
jgi:hypothetical protein